jgi:NADH-quinone oxidoreductase subunit I
MSAAHHDDESTDSGQDGEKVLGETTSSAGKKIRTLQVVRPEPHDASFLAASAKGFGITLKHFARNLFKPLRSAKGRATAGAPEDENWMFGMRRNDIETVQYPEEKVKYPERFRGLHRLMMRDDGAVRCVACMCCPTVCPAHCITIIPAETDDKGIEKKPAVFEIDELRCVVCGLCVEACPCDAIRMDTGDHAKPTEERADGIETLETMLARGIRSTAKQGGEGPRWRELAADTPDGEVNR